MMADLERYVPSVQEGEALGRLANRVLRVVIGEPARLPLERLRAKYCRFSWEFEKMMQKILISGNCLQ